MTKTRCIWLLAAALSGCQALWGFEGFQAGGGVSRGGEGGEAGSPEGEGPRSGGGLVSGGGSGARGGAGGNLESAGGGPACAVGERGCVGRYDELLAYACSEDQSRKIFSPPCKDELSQCSANYGCVSVELDEYEISLQQYFEFVAQTAKERESGKFSPFSEEEAEACEGTNVEEIDPGCVGEMSYCRACVKCEAEGGDCADACADCDRQAPMVCVNWCQAMAYCRFWGGRLCGALGPAGAMDAPAPFNDLSSERSPEESAWSHACAATSALWSPRTYSPGYEDLGGCVFAGATNPKVRPSDDPGDCHSVIYGYSNLNHLSGNVAEWEDSCVDGGDPSAECRVRGGSFRSWNEEEIACSHFATMRRDAVGPHVGFRCCYPEGRPK